MPVKAHGYTQLAQEGRRAPEERGLAVEVADVAPAIHVVLVVVLLVRALADIADVAVGVDVLDEREPGFARRRAVGLPVEPAFLHARHHRESEHARGGGLGPGLRAVYQ